MKIKETMYPSKKILGYKFRLYPNQEQIKGIQEHIDISRYLYNKTLGLEQQTYQNHQENPDHPKMVGKFSMFGYYTVMKEREDTPWLKESSVEVSQCAITKAYAAYQNFFTNPKHFGFPQFKKKGRSKESFTFNRPNVKDGLVTIPKIGKVKFKQHRKMEGKIKQATVSKVAGQYFISFIVDQGRYVRPLDIKTAMKNVVGIDLGARKLATLSDDTIFENLKVFKTYQGKLATLQLKQSLKLKGSNGYQRLKTKIAKLHAKIARIRKDMLHRISYHIVNNYDLIGLEDLNIKGMLKNSKVARVLSDASLSELVNQITYKAQRLGKRGLHVNRFYPSSKTCNNFKNI